MKKEKELLRKQMLLLSEQSKGALENDLAELSDSMCEVYRLLVQSYVAFFANLIMGANLVVCFLILLKKLFRSNA